MAELAIIASEVIGRDVRHTVVADEEWRNARIAAGMPAFYAELLLGMFKAARRGDLAANDSTLEQLLGRPPRTMKDVLTASLGQRQSHNRQEQSQ
jgi:hypothetical protein